MKSFDSFFTDLTSDQLWHEQASMYHKPETFEKCARQVWMQGVADGVLKPIQECRKHVFNIVKDLPHDRVRVDWTKKALEKLEVEKQEPPVSWEKRAEYLEKIQEIIKGSKTISAMPRLTAREIIDEGDWKAVPPIQPRTEIERAMLIEEHKEKVRLARAKVFKTHFPDASEEEVSAYCNKFSLI